MNVYKHYLLIFGGRSGLALEKNDLYCFDIENKKWAELEGINDFEK